MRIAVISDIHGNCLALEAALADIERHPPDQMVCLGDAIQGGAQPAETVRRLRELACPVVMGNADAWLLTGIDTGTAETVSNEQLEVREWSLSKLSSADRQFIAGFQPTVEIPLDGERTLLCFHGSPHSFDDILLPETAEEEFRCLLGSYSASILTGGHMHTQQIRRLAGDAFFFNPGSVGFAYNLRLPADQFRAESWAEYAVLSVEDGCLGLEFRRVPYDVGALTSVILASGRPYAEKATDQYRQEK